MENKLYLSINIDSTILILFYIYDTLEVEFKTFTNLFVVWRCYIVASVCLFLSINDTMYLKDLLVIHLGNLCTDPWNFDNTSSTLCCFTIFFFCFILYLLAECHDSWQQNAGFTFFVFSAVSNNPRKWAICLSAEWINECLKVWIAEQTWDGANNTSFSIREIGDKY